MKTRNPDCDPDGFTIVELLVSLTIIGLLLALILPAVQSARETARRTECLNNLRGFGQAMSSFETSKGYFPPSGDQSPQAHMLNWLGYPERYGSIDFTTTQWFLGQYSFPGGAILPEWASVPIATFRCPSDGGGRGCNYVACTGIGVGMGDVDRRLDGAFAAAWRVDYKRGTLAAEITDGLSNTVGFSEVLVSDDEVTTYDATRDAWWSGAVTNPPFLTNDQFAAACDSLTAPPTAIYPRVGLYWHCWGYGCANYNHIRLPNSMQPHCLGPIMEPDPADITPATTGIVTARSAHPQGVNVLLMDGSARMAHDNIDLRVWRALATMAGSETSTEF